MMPMLRLREFAAKLRAKPAALVFALIFAAHLGRYLVAVNVDYYPGGDGYYICHYCAAPLYRHVDVLVTEPNGKQRPYVALRR